MNDWFAYFLILFVVGFIIKIYFESDMFHLKCIVSNEDGNTYCVRESPKLELVAGLLARTTEKLKQLVAFLKELLQHSERNNLNVNLLSTVFSSIFVRSSYVAKRDEKAITDARKGMCICLKFFLGR